MSTEKHWASRQPAKTDEVRDLFAHGLDFALARKKEVAAAAGAAIAVAAAIGLFVYARSAKENEAWDKLTFAEAYSYYGRGQEAATALSEVAAQTASPAAAGLASMMEGELKQSKGEHDAALASFSRAADVAPAELKPFAAAERVTALEIAGKNTECAAAAAAFLEAHDDHFLAPQVNETLARCQAAAGQLPAARATWQKITLRYADTPWAARANARLQAPTK